MMEFEIGSRAAFHFEYIDETIDLTGSIVGWDDNGCAWFMPDDQFEIPHIWTTTNRHPGAFATVTRYLTPIPTAMSKIDISELL